MIIPSPREFAGALGRFLWAAITRRPLFVDQDHYRARIDECVARSGSCYDASCGQCRLCTCFIHPKARLATEKCPAGFWRRVFFWTQS
jgi:hypothetical protein